MSKKISELGALTTQADADLLECVDTTAAPDSKRITIANHHAQVRTGAGVVASPAVQLGEAGTGIYRSAPSSVAVALGGSSTHVFQGVDLYFQFSGGGIIGNVANSFLKLQGSTTTGATEAVRAQNGNAFSGASGAQKHLAIRSTVNQSGSAGHTDLLIVRTETALGSGAQNALAVDAGAAGTTRVLAITNAGEIAVAASGQPATSLDVNGDIAARAVSPAALAAGENNDYTGANGRTFVRLTPDAGGSTITGFADGQDGRLLVVANVAAAGALTIAHQSASSTTAANRIITLIGSSVVLAADDVFLAIYDASTARWRQISSEAHVGATAPTTIQPDDAAAGGSSAETARVDHKHAIVAAAPSSIGTANAEGAATSFARSDHVHDAGVSRQIQARYQHAGDALGTDTVSERPFYRSRGAATLFTIHYVDADAETGNDTNNFVITIRRRDGSGGAAVTVVAYTNNVASGGMAAFDPKDLGGLANTTLAADNILTIEVTKNGTGQTLGAGCLVVDITRD